MRLLKLSKQCVYCSTSALLLSTLSSYSFAETRGKFYIAIKAETGIIEDAEITGNGQLALPGIGNFPFTTSGNVEYNELYGLGTAVGYRITDSIRSELAFDYREAKSKKSILTATDALGLGASASDEFDGSEAENIESYALMINGYYDLKTGTAFEPYIGAGIGVLHEDNLFKDQAFAYQAMAGLSYNINEHHALYGGYKYASTTGLEGTQQYDDGISSLTNHFESNLASHALEVGYRFTF